MHRLLTLGGGELAELVGQDEEHGGLDFARRDGLAAIAARQSTGLDGNALEEIVDERVHDVHGTLRYTAISIHLLEHLVDEGAVRVVVALGVALLPDLRHCLLGTRHLGR